MPFISICIPAYKRLEYLERLLSSISIQTFKDFEVIITDDSNDSTVENFISQYNSLFPVIYVKNAKALGSPENWNASMRLAKGRWIKMMHDDDWFFDKYSLAKFANAGKEYPDTPFIFSGYTETDIKNQTEKSFIINNFSHFLLKKSPLNLFKKNFIGHPSTTLIKNGYNIYYDNNLKWVVDFEYYIRYLQSNKKFIAIKESLIRIGINDFQITKEAFRNREIEIPENLYLLNKLSVKSLKNIFMYDYFWRLIRNLSIRTLHEVKQHAGENEVQFPIIQIIHLQQYFPLSLLKIGIVSKSLMLLSYSKNYFRL